MASLFISHSSRDNDAADQLRRELRAQGFKSFFLDFDPEAGIPVGADWEEEIYFQLKTADAVIFLSTEAARRSHWCFAELALSRALGKPIFPLDLDGTTAHPLLGAVQWLKWDPGNGDGLEPLRSELERRGIDVRYSFSWDRNRSPYPGLAAFEEERAAVFAGRDTEIREIRARLDRPLADATAGLTLIIGPSGSGKSSLVRAGLIPRLKGMRERWIVVPPVRPEEAPLEMVTRNVSRAFQQLGHEREWRALRNDIEARSKGLLELGRDLIDASGGRADRVLVVVDQAEELLTRADERERATFFRVLTDSLSTHGPLRVVMTLRSEFLTQFIEQPELGSLIHEPVLLPPLDAARMPEVIEGPGGAVGLEFAQGLVLRMVQETGRGEALPLLAFALRELFESVRDRGRRQIGIADYERIGGVIGALEGVADGVMATLQRAGKTEPAILETLLKLVHLDPAAEPTRRRRKRRELSVSENEIVDAFLEERLLSSRGEGDDTLIEAAHEALFLQWPPLKKAIEDRRDQLRFAAPQVRFGLLAREWDERDRDAAFLLRGAQLSAAKRWLSDPDQPEPADALVLTYITASDHAKDRRTRVMIGALVMALLLACLLLLLTLAAR
jgi:energy-coupling factor transporter ATP-binding protein EcfA2